MYRRFNSLCSISNGEMTISITDNATGDYQNRRYTLVDRLFNIRDDVPDCALTPVHSFSRKRNTMPTYDNPAMLLVDRISFIPDTLVVNFESGERFESYVIQRGDGE